jgi:ligand-binding sensor domain-containing protein
MIRQLLLLLFLCVIKVSFCQNLAIGEWSLHLNYTNTTTITESNNRIYVGTKSGLFIYNKLDNSVTTLSKLDGLSDLNISSICYSDTHGSLIIGYKNGNIDILKNNQVINLPYINTAQIITNKTINHIFMDGDLAYLSCAFGLVVLNIEKYEVSETYYFSNDGTYVEANECFIFDSEMNSPQDIFLANKIFVGTEKGLFYADINSNLLDFESWSNDSRLSLSKSNNSSITPIENKVVTKVIGFEKSLNTGNSSSGVGKQLIIGTELDYSKLEAPWLNSKEYNFFQFNSLAYHQTYIDENNLNLFNVNLGVPGDIIDIYYNSNVNKSIIISNDNNTEKVIILNEFFNNILSVNTSEIEQVPSEASIVSSIISSDYINTNYIYLADSKKGLIKAKTSQYNINVEELISPNGPVGVNMGSTSSTGNVLMFSHGGKTNSWNNIFNYQEASVLKNNIWESSSTLIEQGVYDLVEVCGNDNQKGHFFVGTWNNGLLEFINDSLMNIYDESNSSLQSISSDGWIRVGGIDFDQNGALWVTNSQADQPLSKFSNNTWSSFTVPNWSNNIMAGKLMCLENGQKWVQLRNEGIIVVKENDTSVLSKKLGSSQGLPSQTVNCFMEDNDGAVWVGTSQGLSVFYFPSELFNNDSANSEYILIETEDGYVERLFENTEILDIEVDGGNRKWIATKTNGVFLISDDGTSQIAHFTKENSPLLHNTVSDIEIIGASGIVFFTTDSGLCSYRSNATKTESSFNNVTVYPNPVRRHYNGTIAISGLTDNTNVKIADVGGNIVFETTSVGGTAIWDGLNFSGEKVASGVYLFFCTNENFNESIVKKILIYN